MGTRNLTMVISNKQTKVAQYGQWDGYPERQGFTILKFLRKVNLNKFKAKVDNLRFMTEEDMRIANEYIQNLPKDGSSWSANDNCYGKYAWLSRDTGGQILTAIMGNPVSYFQPYGEHKKFKYKVDFVKDDSNFAADSLFCEWAYVIDLDKGTFEVYKGFNKTPLGKDHRFRYMQDLNLHMDREKDGTLRHNGYYPVRLLKKFKLNDLPTPQQFLKACIGDKAYAEHLKYVRGKAKARKKEKTS